MKKLIVLCLLIALAIPIGLVNAQDPIPGTKADNACNVGGALDGKCTTEWHCICGWYLARWEANGGWSNLNNPFNNACLGVLPPQPLPGEMTSVCLMSFGSIYVCFFGDGTSTADFLITPKSPDLRLTTVVSGNIFLCPAGTIVPLSVTGAVPAVQTVLLALGYQLTDFLCYGFL